jgi:guanylate kinase
MTRSVEVIFITGGTQSGKTTFAKWLCRSMNYSYAISSGFNDPLQDYEGQDCLILDDIRDNTFRYDELLKITDNHTNSSVRSRYSNKLFVGRMIIITSTKDLQNWYVEYRNNNKDDINQLITRINAYIHMNEKFIFNYENDEITKVAKGQQVTIPPERIHDNSVRKFYAERAKQSPAVRNLLDKLANNSFDIVQALKQDPDFKG